MRLTPDSLALIAPQDVALWGYDRAGQEVGIVHFGIGAFHRAHMAWYTDAAMRARETGWMIAGVSLRSGDVANQLNPQVGLYTLTERSGSESETRVIGSVREVLVASHDEEQVIKLIAAPATRIISFTITEKGYCRAADGSLDPALAGDTSVYAYLARGLRRRHDAGLPGVTLLCCDNLADNGHQLEALMRAYLALHDPALIDWFAAKCTCPCTMVDRIVPATTPADLEAVADALDELRDHGAVMTERFSQWVIEDRFAGPRPAWQNHGAQMVADVAPYETAKLRMLNGAHSALAYLGLDRGHEYVHQAIADPELRALVDQLMLHEAATSFTPAPGQNLPAYASELVQRFADPALNHRLIQIAMDGSQKVPQRWLETLAAHQAQGRSCPAILTALAAWLRHIRGDRRTVDDPMAAQLAALWESHGRLGIAQALFGPGGLLAKQWQAGNDDLETINTMLGEDA